ncbi:MAG: AbrB/MazE/SpoVT family DNA-binding domain-containing protein [Ardenticatenaceae bacterium]|nr:AbrB/MazE/SpoVT family DNA-binding domain-containing protein [Ardenticatenaceae bacterium]
MTTVSASPKFQIVIPKAIRETLDIQPGQKIQIISYY